MSLFVIKTNINNKEELLLKVWWLRPLIKHYLRGGEDIERIFSNENIKYGYTIFIINDSHMTVEQELILKNEYLSN